MMMHTSRVPKRYGQYPWDQRAGAVQGSSQCTCGMDGWGMDGSNYDAFGDAKEAKGDLEE